MVSAESVRIVAIGPPTIVCVDNAQRIGCRQLVEGFAFCSHLTAQNKGNAMSDVTPRVIPLTSLSLSQCRSMRLPLDLTAPVAGLSGKHWPR
ncbi:hypothetical protein CR51_18285 [Caballeronia megalochromosomata]|nr:hypothetical protein CR51_18285 [Caballeronia megalochromosomata]